MNNNNNNNNINNSNNSIRITNYQYIKQNKDINLKQKDLKQIEQKLINKCALVEEGKVEWNKEDLKLHKLAQKLKQFATRMQEQGKGKRITNKLKSKIQKQKQKGIALGIIKESIKEPDGIKVNKVQVPLQEQYIDYINSDVVEDYYKGDEYYYSNTGISHSINLAINIKHTVTAQDDPQYYKILNSHPLHDIMKCEYINDEQKVVDLNPNERCYIDVLLDCGATISCCNNEAWLKFKRFQVKRKKGFIVLGFQGTPALLKDYLEMYLINRDKLIGCKPVICQTRFYLVENSKYPFLLSNKHMRQMHIKYDTVKDNITNKNITSNINENEKADEYQNVINYIESLDNLDEYPQINNITILTDKKVLNKVKNKDSEYAKFVHHVQQGKNENVLSEDDREYWDNIDYGQTKTDAKLGIDKLTDYEFRCRVSNPENGLIPAILKDKYGNTDETGELREKLIDLLVAKRVAFGEKLIDINSRAPERFNVHYNKKPTYKAPPLPKPYPTSPKAREILKEKTDELLANNMAQVAGPEIEQFMPAFVVFEADEKRKRMVIDARVCNSQCEIEKTMGFDTDGLNQVINQSAIINNMDIKSGFHHIKIHPPHYRYFGFNHYWGLFNFTVLFFGFINAVAVFVRLVWYILSVFEMVHYWMDDIVAGETTMERNIILLDKLLTRVINNNIRLNIIKCKLFQVTITYIGREIDLNKGFRLCNTLLDKIKAVKEPKSWKQIEYIVHFCSFCIGYVIDCSKYVKLIRIQLQKLKSKEFDKHYGGMVKAHVQTLISLILEQKWMKPIQIGGGVMILETDSTDVSLGCILKQVDEKSNTINLCSVWSKGWSKNNLSRHITIKEAMANVLSIEHYRQYLIEHIFILVTDASSLPDKYNLNANTKESRV